MKGGKRGCARHATTRLSSKQGVCRKLGRPLCLKTGAKLRRCFQNQRTPMFFEGVSKNGYSPKWVSRKLGRPQNFPKKLGKKRKEVKRNGKTRQATCRTVSKRSSQRDEQLKADWRASKVVEDAKDLAPVKTGKLRESIKAQAFQILTAENLWNYSLKKYRRNIYYVL